MPAHVVEFYKEGFNRSLEGVDEVTDATLRLLTDQRMNEPWRKLARNYNVTGAFALDKERWGEYFFWAAHLRFTQAIEPEAWDQLTKAEQGAWFARLKKLTRDYADLLKVSPITPNIGPTIDKASFVWFVEQLGLRVVENDVTVPRQVGDEATAQYVGRIESQRLGAARYLMPRTIVECLQCFEQIVAQFQPEEWQPLKKPRDAKASRHRFILTLTRDLVSFYGQKMQELVAVAAEVMFEDPSINIRLVRKFTTGK